MQIRELIRVQPDHVSYKDEITMQLLNQALVMTPGQLRLRREVDPTQKHRRWATSVPHTHGSRYTEEYMAKTGVTLEYLSALEKFMHLYKEQQTATLLDKGDLETSVIVHQETGRKFDKIQLGYLKGGKLKGGKLTVMFFVERTTGKIFGPKSADAPNRTRYYGVVTNAAHWDWAQEPPMPKDETKAGVKKLKAYGKVCHYVDV